MFTIRRDEAEEPGEFCFNPIIDPKMLLANGITEIKSQLKNANRNFDKKIAFVPTMGAFHEGHLALIKKATELAEIIVVSIFVNKAQFNDQTDYEKYPRQIEDDLKKLTKSGATHVFLPQDSEIFPENFSLKIIPTKLTDCLCGKARAGHFEGVALIVSKLFNIVRPNIAIFGQKDFQQLSIIKKLVGDLNFDIEIFAHEILREKSGLAMSSRNQRLSEAGKTKAAEIYKILLEVKNAVIFDEKNLANFLQEKCEFLLKNGFEKIDYLEIRDEENLQLITKFDYKRPARIFIAAHLEGVRLIDNFSIQLNSL